MAMGSRTAQSQNALSTKAQDALSSENLSPDSKAAPALAIRMVEAAGWRLNEFTPEHVEKTFGVTLRPAKSAAGHGVDWESAGSLHVSLYTHGPIIRFLIIDWGRSPNNPIEPDQPKICVSSREISERISERGWKFYGESSDAPLDNVVAHSRNVTRMYRILSNDHHEMRQFNISYKLDRAEKFYCTIQFELSVVPPPPNF